MGKILHPPSKLGSVMNTCFFLAPQCSYGCLTCSHKAIAASMVIGSVYRPWLSLWSQSLALLSSVFTGMLLLSPCKGGPVSPPIQRWEKEPVNLLTRYSRLVPGGGRSLITRLPVDSSAFVPPSLRLASFLREISNYRPG